MSMRRQRTPACQQLAYNTPVKALNKPVLAHNAPIMLDPILWVSYRQANHSFLIPGRRMTVWAFTGSMDKGPPTISGLAASACGLALRPLRVRVLPSGRSPAPGAVRQVPFGTASIPADGAGLAAARTRHLVQRSPECLPVIVSMPCKRIRTTMHMPAGGRSRGRLPMRDRAGRLADRTRARPTGAHPARDG